MKSATGTRGLRCLVEANSGKAAKGPVDDRVSTLAPAGYYLRPDRGLQRLNDRVFMDLFTLMKGSSCI